MTLRLEGRKLKLEAGKIVDSTQMATTSSEKKLRQQSIGIFYQAGEYWHCQ
jgi:hypothetical protein